MVESYTSILTFSLYDSPHARHHHQPFQATAAYILLIYRLSDKPIVTHHKFYQTVAILQTQFPLLSLFPCLQVRKKYISRYFHSYSFVAKLHIFPMKNVTLRTFLIFIVL